MPLTSTIGNPWPPGRPPAADAYDYTADVLDNAFSNSAKGGRAVWHGTGGLLAAALGAAGAELGVPGGQELQDIGIDRTGAAARDLASALGITAVRPKDSRVQQHIDQLDAGLPTGPQRTLTRAANNTADVTGTLAEALMGTRLGKANLSPYAKALWVDDAASVGLDGLHRPLTRNDAYLEHRRPSVFLPFDRPLTRNDAYLEQYRPYTFGENPHVSTGEFVDKYYELREALSKAAHQIANTPGWAQTGVGDSSRYFTHKPSMAVVRVSDHRPYAYRSGTAQGYINPRLSTFLGQPDQEQQIEAILAHAIAKQTPHTRRLGVIEPYGY